jgi:hypothetical protein
MGNPEEKCGEISVTKEMNGKKMDLLENREASLRNQRHLEMAYEWLRSRGEIVPLKGGTKRP